MPPVRVSDRLKGIADVADQREPSGHLQGVGHGWSASEGVRIRAIANQDGDRRMCLQPRGSGFGRTAFEHSDGASALQIDDQRAIDRAPPKGERIHTQDAWRGDRDRLGARPADEEVRAGPSAQQPGHAYRHHRMAGMGSRQQRLSPALSLPGLVHHQAAFSEIDRCASCEHS